MWVRYFNVPRKVKVKKAGQRQREREASSK